MTDDRLAEIRARAEAARQAAASGTTGTPPNIDGLSVNDALDIFHESAEDVPWLLAEVKRLRADRDAQGRFVSVVAEFARTTAMTHGAVMDAVGLKADRDRLATVVGRLREYIDRMPYPSDMDELRAERDRAREDCGHQKAMRAFAEEERDRFIRLYKEAGADRDRLAATVERVRAVAEAGEDEPHNGHASFEGEPECPACWVASIEAALKEGDES